MQVIQDVAIALDALKDSGYLTAIIEGGGEGLLFWQSVAGSLLKNELEILSDTYGDSLRFRAFNREVDINWRGDHGVIVEGKHEDCEIFDIYIETDLKRHPGMQRFAVILGELHSYRLRGQLLNNDTYLRLVEIKKGGRLDAVN